MAAAGDEGPCVDIMEISKPDDLGDIANLGFRPSRKRNSCSRGFGARSPPPRQGTHAVRRPVCPCRDGICQVKGYRDHAVATLARKGEIETVQNLGRTKPVSHRDADQPVFTALCPIVLADLRPADPQVLDGLTGSWRQGHSDALAPAEPSGQRLDPTPSIRIARLPGQLWFRRFLVRRLAALVIASQHIEAARTRRTLSNRRPCRHRHRPPLRAPICARPAEKAAVDVSAPLSELQLVTLTRHARDKYNALIPHLRPCARDEREEPHRLLQACLWQAVPDRTRQIHH